MLIIPALAIMLVYGRVAARVDWKPFVVMAVLSLLLTLIGMFRGASAGDGVPPIALVANFTIEYALLLVFFLQGRALRRWLARRIETNEASAGRVHIDKALLAELAREDAEKSRGEA